jgi:hypothetical protein
MPLMRVQNLDNFNIESVLYTGRDIFDFLRAVLLFELLFEHERTHACVYIYIYRVAQRNGKI